MDTFNVLVLVGILMAGVLGTLVVVDRGPFLDSARGCLRALGGPGRWLRRKAVSGIAFLARLARRIPFPTRVGRAFRDFVSREIPDNLYFHVAETDNRAPADDARRDQRRLLAAVVLIAIAATAAYRAADGALEHMRLVENEGYDSSVMLGGSADVIEALEVWGGWRKQFEDPATFANPVSLAKVAVLLRGVSFTAIAVALGYALIAVRRRTAPEWALSRPSLIEKHRQTVFDIKKHNRLVNEARQLRLAAGVSITAENTRHRQLRDRSLEPLQTVARGAVANRITTVMQSAERSASWGHVATLPYVVFFVLGLVSHGFAFLRARAVESDSTVMAVSFFRGSAVESAPFPWLDWAHTVMTWSLGIFAAVLVGLFLLAPVPDRHLGYHQPEGVRDRFRRIVRGLVALRLGLVTVGAAAALMFVSFLGDQFADVLRRWEWQQLASALLTLVLLSATIFVASDRVAGRVWSDVDRFVLSQTQRSALRQLAGVLIVLLGVIGAGIALSGGTIGRGLMIPAGFVLVIGILQVPEGEASLRAGRTADFARIIPKPLSRLLGLAVPVMLGVALINATLPDLLTRSDPRGLWWLLLPPAVAVVAALAVRVWALTDAAPGTSPVAGVVKWASLIWVILSLAVAAGVLLSRRPHPLRLAPSMDSAISGGVLLGVGLALFALGYGMYYLLSGVDRADTGTCSVCGLYHAASDVPDGRTRMPVVVGRDRPLGLNDLGTTRPVFMGGHITGMLLLAAWIVMDPLGAAPALGTAAVIFLSLTLLAILSEGALRFAEQTDPPALVRMLGFARLPMFLLLVLWGVLANAHTPAQHFHAVEITETAPPTVVSYGPDPVAREDRTWGVAMEQVWERWLEANVVEIGDPPSDGRRGIPLVIVSAWGGGIRAAVWTALVLDCAFEVNVQPPCREDDPGAGSNARSIAAFSGISGGSLGMAEYAAFLMSEGLTPRDWVRERLGGDFLAPTMSRMLLVDLPLHFVGSSGRINDRADVLSSAWEEAWHNVESAVGEGNPLELGLLDAWNQPDVPFFVLNGSIVGENCGFTGTVLRAHIEPLSNDPEVDTDNCEILTPFLEREPATDVNFVGGLVATRELADFLCPGQDIRLSDAALLSARFQYVSPAGWLLEDTSCDGEKPDEADSVFIRDGGNHEPSGAGTALQIWEALEPAVSRFNATRSDVCIVPVMIHIENGFTPEGNKPRPRTPDEFINPLVEAINSYKGLADYIRARAAYSFTFEPLTGARGEVIEVKGKDGAATKRYVFIRTRAHPGAKAPLGWTLSPATVEDLEDQLADNDDEFTTVKSWFDGEMRCSSPNAP